MLADPSSKAASTAGIGPAVAAARKQDGAQPAAVRGAHRAGGGIEPDFAARPMRSAEQGLDRRRVDRRRGQDARAGGRAADFRHRQPFLARQRRGRVEPEAASADAEPVAAVAAAPLRQPVGKGERDAAAERS